MPKDILTKLRNDWLIQEIIINSLPVPALAYFSWKCFPFARQNDLQFLGVVFFTVNFNLFIGLAVRKFAARKMVDFVARPGKSEPEQIRAAKVQAFHFPLVASMVMFVRWALLAGAFVPFPLFLQGKATGFDFFVLEALLFFAAISSMPFSYLCSERALSTFLNIPEIEACPMGDGGGVKLRINGKIFLLNLFSIIPLAGNFCAVLIIAHYYSVNLAAIKLGFFLFIVQAFVLTMLNGYLLSINIREFFGEILTFFEDMTRSQGDLNRKIVVGSNDELGDLAQLFNFFMVNLKKMILDIKANSDSLDGVSRNLEELSGRMSERVAQSLQTSNAVASSSEEMGVSLTSIVQSIEQASENVETVAASTEEMSSTVNEIAQHSAKARGITETAVENVASAKAQVDELGTNAREIDQVTEVISEISEQTNLLALNATIEAARAGEAGKGFSVVANEIKELARQTSQATTRIKQMVAAIQKSSNGTTEQINRISGIINKVNEYVASIAAAVEQQSNANREIATTVSEVSRKNQLINTNVSQISVVTNDIIKDIAEVSQSMDGVSEDSKEIRQFGKDMAELSAGLQQMVARFNLS